MMISKSGEGIRSRLVTQLAAYSRRLRVGTTTLSSGTSNRVTLTYPPTPQREAEQTGRGEHRADERCSPHNGDARERYHAVRVRRDEPPPDGDAHDGREQRPPDV